MGGRSRRERSIGKLRAQRVSGPAVATRRGIPRATAGRVHRRQGLGPLPLATSPSPVSRYEHEPPGATASGHEGAGLHRRCRPPHPPHPRRPLDARGRAGRSTSTSRSTSRGRARSGTIARAAAGSAAEWSFSGSMTTTRLSLPLQGLCRTSPYAPYTPRSNGNAECCCASRPMRSPTALRRAATGWAPRPSPAALRLSGRAPITGLRQVASSLDGLDDAHRRRNPRDGWSCP